MDIPEQEQQDVNSILDKLAGVPPASLKVSPLDCFLLASYLQLALTHPQAGGITGKRIEEIARTLQEALASHAPEVGEILEKGWHSKRDIPRLVVESEASQYFSTLHMYRQMEIVVQITALGLTCDLLSQMLPLSSNKIMTDALRKADELVKQMPEIEISNMINDLDQSYHNIYSPDETHDNN